LVLASSKIGKKVESLEFQMVIKSRKVGSGEINFRIYSCLLDVISMDSQRYFRKSQEDLLQIPLGRFKGPTCNAMGKLGRIDSSKNAWRVGFKKYFSFLQSVSCQV
jgi:hypothetical protein